jgi:hypothetical protein
MGACSSVEHVHSPPSSERSAISAVPTKISNNPVAATSPVLVSVKDASMSVSSASSIADQNQYNSASESAPAITSVTSQKSDALAAAAAVGSEMSVPTAAVALAGVESPKKPLKAGGLPETVRASIVGEAVIPKDIKAELASSDFSSQLEKIYSK